MSLAFTTPVFLTARAPILPSHVSRARPFPNVVPYTPRMAPPVMTSASVKQTSKPRPRPGERKGFVEEMRLVAMRLHTKDQAPREGEMEESALPISEWYPSKEEFMQFLVDSMHVYSFFETELCGEHGLHTDMFGKFGNTGLERCQALEEDIAYLEALGVGKRQVGDAGKGYVEYLRRLIVEKPESVLCHWYNYYFAHSAGGRMIGKLMQDRLFGGRSFRFYEWEGDVKQHLGNVRTVIDDTAKDWSRDLKDECLKETSLAFGYSGTVLQYLAKNSTSQ